MRLPRDISGVQLAGLLSRTYGYEITRQRGSHIRLTGSTQGFDHHVTIPNHSSVRLGTLSNILGEVATYLGIDRDEVIRELFGG